MLRLWGQDVQGLPGGLGGPFWLVEALAFLPGFPLPQRPGLGKEIETWAGAAVSQSLLDLLPLASASSQLGLCRGLCGEMQTGHVPRLWAGSHYWRPSPEMGNGHLSGARFKLLPHSLAFLLCIGTPCSGLAR